LPDGGRVFSPAGAEVELAEDINTQDDWRLYAAWDQDGYSNLIYIDFFRKDDEWYALGLTWEVAGLTLTDGSPASGDFGLGSMNASRTPVGETYAGGLTHMLDGFVTPCQAAADGGHYGQNTDAVLSTQGLRLAVTPHERSIVDKALRFLRLNGGTPAILQRFWDESCPDEGPRSVVVQVRGTSWTGRPGTRGSATYG
jgi:hypothetical protein